MPTDDSMSRRRVMKAVGGASTVGLASLAGCSGDGDGGGGGDGGDGSTEGDESTTSGGQTSTSSGDGGDLTFTIGGVMSPPGSQWNGQQPSGHWELEKRLEEQTDGRIQVENVAEGQLCTETTCPDKVSNKVLEVGSASIGNSSKFFPMNDIWMMPYTFPHRNALAHTLTKEETFEQFWVPFAQEYGVVPLWYHAPALRQVHVGLDKAENTDGPHLLPGDIANTDIRRTGSQASGIALNAWGANPVSVSWSDTLQGLRTGVVAGMEASISPICAYGGNMADSLAETIDNKWTIHCDTKWANVEWLKSLSDENRNALADVSRGVYTDLVHMNDKLHEETLGIYTDNPPEDSCTVEHDLQVNYLEDDQMQEWKDQVSPEDNSELYSDIIDSADNIGIDGQAFHEYLWDSARENSVPTDTQEFSIDAWWDDYLQEM